MEGSEKALLGMARRQHGVVTMAQARACGLSAEQVKYRREVGRLVPVHRGVYVVAGSERSPHQGLMAAVLATRGVVSHRAAAALWQLRGCEAGGLEVTVVARRPPSRPGALVHTTTSMERIDRTVRWGVPVTTPARTVVDLASVVGPELLEPALEDALLRGLVSFGLLERTVERLGGPGRRGGVLLRGLLADRAPGQAPTESLLEDAVVATLREGGLPPPVRQLWVRSFDGRRMRIDLAYPDARLAIEVDSRRWHGGRADMVRNADKANALVLSGWRLLRFRLGRCAGPRRWVGLGRRVRVAP